MAQVRERPRLVVTVSAESAQVVRDVAETFYGGNVSKAVDAAIRAWAVVVRDPAAHGLAGDPAGALQRYSRRKLP